jgi:hypothetical protein
MKTTETMRKTRSRSTGRSMITDRDKQAFVGSPLVCIPCLETGKFKDDCECCQSTVDNARRALGYSRKTATVDIFTALVIAMKRKGLSEDGNVSKGMGKP